MALCSGIADKKMWAKFFVGDGVSVSWPVVQRVFPLHSLLIVSNSMVWDLITGSMGRAPKVAGRS